MHTIGKTKTVEDALKLRTQLGITTHDIVGPPKSSDYVVQYRIIHLPSNTEVSRHSSLNDAVNLFDRLGPETHTISAHDMLRTHDRFLTNVIPLFIVREYSSYMVDEPIVWFIDESFHGQIATLFKDVTTKRLSDEPNKSHAVKIGTYTICYTKLPHIANQISRAIEGSRVVSNTWCVMC